MGRKSEIVSTIKELKQQNADEFAPEVKKMMGPFGKVVLLSKTNQLLLQDSVGNLRQIMDIIDKNEASDTSVAETYSYKCKYIRASSAEVQLRNFLGDPKQVIEYLQKRDNPDDNKQFDERETDASCAIRF